MKVEEIPSIEMVKFGHASIPDDTEERISFLCKVFDPTRDLRLTLARTEFNIPDDFFAERMEETRKSVELSVRAGAVARAAAQTARRAGLVTTDDEQAELASDLLDRKPEGGIR